MTDEPKAFPYSPIDVHSPVPLYHQIYLDLRQALMSGAVPPGGLFPTELEICHAYGVGRQTVRQAIARLVDEDLLERFAGRGTFVRQESQHVPFLLERSFSRQMRDLGRVPSSRVLCAAPGVVDYDNIVELRPLKGEACLELARLRLADEQPVCHQISIVLTARCPGIEKADFARQSLYDILANEYQLVITRIEHRVRAVAADEFRARLLGTADGSPLLYVAATAYAGDGAVIEHSTSYYRTDNYEFRTTQVNATGG